jgi:hypothetical protein
MPGLDVPTEKSDALHCTLVRGKSDHHRIDLENPFLQTVQCQRLVTQIVEDNAVPSVCLERREDVSEGYGNALRGFIAYVMIDVDKYERH